MKKPMWIAIALLCVIVLIGIWIIVGAANNPTAPDNTVWAMIPMVMVDGDLYLDTGYESKRSVDYETVDGEITSSVPGNEQPAENNQSNFGAGYSYRFGPKDGIIELHSNGKWWVFATKEMRDRLFSTGDRYSLLFVANTSLQQTIVLTEDKPYWCINIENEGAEAINVEIAGVVYKVEPGASATLSTNTKQDPGTYIVSFATAGSAGMEGHADCESSAIPWETHGAVIVQDLPN